MSALGGVRPLDERAGLGEDLVHALGVVDGPVEDLELALLVGLELGEALERVAEGDRGGVDAARGEGAYGGRYLVRELGGLDVGAAAQGVA